MKQYLFVILISILGWTNSVSQIKHIALKNEEIDQYLLTKDIFTIPNVETGELLLFLGDKNDIWVYKYDKKYNKILDFKVTNNIHSKFTSLLGYRISGDRYYLVTANESLNKIELFTLDLSKRVMVKEDNNIDFKYSKEEKFIESFQVENSLYFLSSNDQSTLFLRKLGDNNDFELLKKFELINFANKGMTLTLKELFPSFWDSFWQSGMLLKQVNNANIPKIIYGTSSPKHIIANKTKLYQDNSLIHLVGDLDNETTVIQTIDLINLTEKQYVIPFHDDKNEFTDHNSFLFENFLFQINASKKAMTLQVKNLQGEILNELKLTEKVEGIKFANPPNLIEGHDFYTRNKKLPSAKKFLKHLSFLNLGLNVFKSGNNYAVQIGNYYESKNAYSSNLAAPEQKSKYINTYLNEEFKTVEINNEPSKISLYRDYLYDMRYKVSSYTYTNGESVFLLYFNHPTEELKLIEF